MVVFTCNNCGESLQKPKVAKHYEFQCRTAPFVSCVDCFKDFRGEEYVAHTKCITEAQRYGGKDYVSKAGANKGERKQQEWLNIVNSILNSETKLSNSERNFLKTLSKFDNIPRKKAKFLNFVRNAVPQKANSALVDSVWNIMETAYKENVENTTEKQQQANGKVDQQPKDKKDVAENQENNDVENQNNENISKENQSEDQQTQSNETHGTDNNTDNKAKRKKKKLKKRGISETVEGQTEEPVSEKKRENGSIEEPVPKKKSKNNVHSESLNTQTDDVADKPTFDWKATILEVVQSKGEISLKKLQKKVISRYMTFCSDAVTNEKATAKFNKKLKRVSKVVISEEKVKLA